jgi:hypothetical protein
MVISVAATLALFVGGIVRYVFGTKSALDEQ